MHKVEAIARPSRYRSRVVCWTPLRQQIRVDGGRHGFVPERYAECEDASGAQPALADQGEGHFSMNVAAFFGLRHLEVESQ